MANLDVEIDPIRVRSALFALITARLEDAHMFAVKGQSRDLDAASARNCATDIRSILDEVLIQLAELEAERLENLRTSGRLLAQAEEIRALVKRVKAAVVAGQTTITEEDLVAWKEWACRYADGIDPVISGQVLSHMKTP